MEHKEITFPHVELTPDDGDPRWRQAGKTMNKDGTWNGLCPGFWASYWQSNVVNTWVQTVEDYEAAPHNVYRAWRYIDDHLVFWKFDSFLSEYPDNHLGNLTHSGAWQRGWPEITPHMICPETGAIEEDSSRNTEVRWWYEFGPVDITGVSISHDYELDGGASTYEKCVLDIAGKIHKYYGNDRSLVDQDDYWENRKI